MRKRGFDDGGMMNKIKSVAEFHKSMVQELAVGNASVQIRKHGTREFAQKLAAEIDGQARLHKSTLHHMYEWGQTGQEEGRLFKMKYWVNQYGGSVSYEFLPSTTTSDTSDVPFANKAQIMEEGRTIVVKPKKAQVLAFEIEGEQVFTPHPVVITQPGGPDVAGSMDHAFERAAEAAAKEVEPMVTKMVEKGIEGSQRAVGSVAKAGLGAARGAGIAAANKIARLI